MRVDSFFQDIRYGIRTLRKAPLFAATVVATMGLGLGLLGSAFTILNAYVLKPIDLPNPNALYSLSWETDTTRRQASGRRFGLADYEALQPEARQFIEVAAAQDVAIMQTSVSTPGLLVTGNYFELLGARPALGRLLTPDDAATRGGEAVVVISHRTWRARYGSDPAIVGQRILLGRQRFEVVGVTEPYAYLPGQEQVSFWAPLTMAGAFPGIDPWSEPGAPSLVVVGRLRQDVTAVRLALGASRWRVARQLIVESLVLAVPAAAVGFALIMVTVRVFPAAILATFPAGVLPLEDLLVPLDPDVRVMAFLSAAAVLSAVLITLAPVGRLARMRLAHASRGEASSDARGSRLRSGLVAMQVGACALFLVGAMVLLDESSRLANPQFNLSFDRVSFIVSHSLDRPRCRVGGCGWRDQSLPRLNRDPAEVRSRSFFDRGRDSNRRDRRGGAAAAACRRADRSCASASNGVK